MVRPAALILKRLYFLLRELVLMQAGWLPGTAHWPSKLLLPELLWQDAITVDQLRRRILELRYPERTIDQAPDEKLVAWWRLLRDAPHGIAFVAGLAWVAKPVLRNTFARYLAETDPLDDGPTCRILRHAVQDLDEHLHRLEEVIGDARTTRPEEHAEAVAWVNTAGAAIRAAVGDLLSTREQDMAPPSPTTLGGRPFEISRVGARDTRFNCLKFGWPDSLDPAFGAGEGLQLQVRQAVHHANEIWAAEMAAACLFDLAGGAEPTHFSGTETGTQKDLDPDWLVDAARWCYDEIRHCRMGYRRLRNWGFADAQIPIGSFSYDAGAGVDPVTRLGVIFYFESTYIHTKSTRMKYFGNLGDDFSSHDMDYDWADEQVHAHYGARWLTYFLARAGDSRKPMEFRLVAEACIERARRTATPEDRRQTLGAFEKMMAAARSLAC
jgi:hypothetical protein